jgi:tetratricopeptide (TPR) repeat protein
MRKLLFFFFFIMFIGARIVSLSFFEEGERLFLDNKPGEALEMLEAALAEGSENEKLYVYLGIIYEQLELHEKAVSIMEVGLKTAKDSRHTLLFNIGNNLFAQDKQEQAEQRYTEAIEVNGSMAEA